MQTVKLYNNTEQFLYEIAIPEKTSSYTPISHGAIINKIREEADKNNIVINNIYKSIITLKYIFYLYYFSIVKTLSAKS